MAKTAVPTESMTNLTPTHDEIAAHAYQIYLREGCIEGRDMEHWLQAEAELRQRGNGNGQPVETGAAASIERATVEPRPTAKPPQERTNVLPNSVVSANAPIAQVTRGTTPKRPSGKREAAAAK